MTTRKLLTATLLAGFLGFVLGLVYSIRHTAAFRTADVLDVQIIQVAGANYVVDTGSTSTSMIYPEKLCILDRCVEPRELDNYMLFELSLIYSHSNIVCRGVIGQDLLKQFSRVEFDYARKSIVFNK